MFDIKTQHIAFILLFFTYAEAFLWLQYMCFLSCIVEDGGLKVRPLRVKLCWILYVHNKVD